MRLDFQHGSGSVNIPMWTPSVAYSAVDLSSYWLTVYNWMDQSALAINGNSSLDRSNLTLQGQGTGSLAPGALLNNGTMTLQASTLKVGALGGQGKIFANSSTVEATRAPTSETIIMRSSYLDIGGDANDPNPGMHFLAPVAGFDSSSVIQLEDTHATLEVYFRQSGALYLFDGPNMVAQMHVSGSPTSPAIYATQNTPLFGRPSVTLSAVDHHSAYAIPKDIIG